MIWLPCPGIHHSLRAHSIMYQYACYDHVMIMLFVDDLSQQLEQMAFCKHILSRCRFRVSPSSSNHNLGSHPYNIIYVDRVSSRGNHFGGEAPGNGRGFIYFSIQLSQILGGKLPPRPPPLDETLVEVHVHLILYVELQQMPPSCSLIFHYAILQYFACFFSIFYNKLYIIIILCT